MIRKRFWFCFLCVMLVAGFAGGLIAQEQQKDEPKKEEKQQRRGRRSWPWKGPEIGSEIKDFELSLVGDDTFKLSEKKGKIVIIELGACT